MANNKKDADRYSIVSNRNITRAERDQMIAEAAYYLAERRGFKGGCDLHDWLEAEARIDRIFGERIPYQVGAARE